MAIGTGGRERCEMVRVTFIIAEDVHGEVAAAVHTQSFSSCRCQASVATCA